MLRLVQEIEKRLPDDMEMFRKISLYSPKQLFSKDKPRFRDLPFVEHLKDVEDVDAIEEQWRQVTDEPWQEYELFKDLEVGFSLTEINFILITNTFNNLHKILNLIEIEC